MLKKFISEVFEVLTCALQPNLVPFSGALVIISTSSHLAEMSHPMHASLCRRFLCPTLRSAPCCITSLTMLSSLVASSQSSYLSLHSILPPNFWHISPLVSQAILARLRQMVNLMVRSY